MRKANALNLKQMTELASLEIGDATYSVCRYHTGRHYIVAHNAMVDVGSGHSRMMTVAKPIDDLAAQHAIEIADDELAPADPVFEIHAAEAIAVH